jgi:hypothetical protein
MADTIATRIARLRVKRAELGQRRRELYLTEDEWMAANRAVQKIRKGKCAVDKAVDK